MLAHSSTMVAKGCLNRTFLQIFIKPEHFAMQSFRRGGMIDAWVSRVDGDLLKLHGRWISEAINENLQLPNGMRRACRSSAYLNHSSCRKLSPCRRQACILSSGMIKNLVCHLLFKCAGCHLSSHDRSLKTGHGRSQQDLLIAGLSGHGTSSCNNTASEPCDSECLNACYGHNQILLLQANNAQLPKARMLCGTQHYETL